MEHIEAIIMHYLTTAFFLLGVTVGQEIEGLAMGSALGGAVTRMVLIFLDLVYYYGLHQLPLAHPKLRGRLRREVVLGIAIIILEMRYMDDYFALWKCVEIQSDLILEQIASSLQNRIRRRYCLPLEDDLGATFVGLQFSGSGPVQVRPKTWEAPTYAGEFDYPAYVHFCSYAPEAMKRALLLGIVSRIERYTIPLSDAPAVLLEFITVLRSLGFPLYSLVKLLKKAARPHRAWLLPVSDRLQ